MKIAVFASGNGSNLQAIIDAVEAGMLDVTIGLVVCDQPHAKARERAALHHIPTFSFRAKEYETKQAFESDILAQLRMHEIDWIFLAGYMRLIGDVLLTAYNGRIVNIHPSLLPAFPGKDAIGQAVTAGVEKTGVTVHYVDEGMDTGPIIAQQEVAIEAGDTRETLQRRMQAVEHVLYVNTIRNLVAGVNRG